MPSLIPENCIDTNPVTQKLYQSLYNQLGPDYKVVQYLKKPSEDSDSALLTGSIFWIQYKKQSLFLYISELPSDFFDKTTKSNAELIKSRLFNNDEFMALLRFQNRLLPSPLQPHKARLTPFLLVFPNIDEKHLNIGIKSLGLYLLGKNKVTSSKLHKYIGKYMGEPLSDSSHHHLRCVFNSELALVSHQVDNRLLDNEQEIAIKNDLLLENTKDRAIHLNLRGVNGSVNSGKSEVILQRARLLDLTKHTTNESKKVLIITPNNASQLSLNKRYYSLHPSDKKTEILSFNQLCSQLLNSTKTQLDDEQIFDDVDRLIGNELYSNNITQSLFFQEINFILGRTLYNKKDYIRVARNTHTYNLTDKQCSVIWESLQIIKNELELSNSLLGIELPQLLWSSLQHKNTYEFYDHILLDDAHLFPPIAFEIIKKLIKPKSGQLFITQNPNQMLLNSCRIWHDLGLELRGHSTRLLNSYEINPYILNAASSFYLHRLPNNVDRKIHRNLPDISESSMPTLLQFHSHIDENNRLLNKVRTLTNEGVAAEDILIISIKSNQLSHYEDLLKQTLNIRTNILKGHDQQQDGIGLCSLLNVHGQKASYVFILGLHHIYAEEKKCGFGTDEYIALHKDNTKRLTVAMTCAKKELTLFLTAELIPRDFINPHLDIPSLSSEVYAEVHALHA